MENFGGLHARSTGSSANRSSLRTGLLGCRSFRPSMRRVDAMRKRALRALEPTKQERHEERLDEDEGRQSQGEFEVALVDFEQNRGAEGPRLPSDVPAQDERRGHLRKGTPVPHEDGRRPTESGFPEKGDRPLGERRSARVDDLDDLRRKLCHGGDGQTGNQRRGEKRLPQENGDGCEEESEVPEGTLPTEEKVEEDAGNDRWKGVERIDDGPDRTASGKPLEDQQQTQGDAEQGAKRRRTDGDGDRQQGNVHEFIERDGHRSSSVGS